MRWSIREGMLESVYVRVEFVDGLFCRRELYQIVSNPSRIPECKNYTDVISMLSGRMSALDSD